MEGRGVEGNGGDGKEKEGNNVLPHLKRAVAAYGVSTAVAPPCELASNWGVVFPHYTSLKA